MKHKILSMTLPLCLLMALAAAFLFTSPAFAQDEVPPVPVEAPAETPDVSTGEEVPVETPVAEALAEAGVVLAGEDGEPLPLASATAAEVLANGDPFFKVGTITYRFMEDCTGWTDCSEGANPIQRAIDAIKGGLTPTDGMLYFDSNTSYTEDLLIDNVAGFKGMIGGPELAHVVSPDTYEPTVTINGTVSIRNMLSGFTINGFKIIGSAGAPDDDLDGTPDHPQGVLDFYTTAGALKLSNLVVRNTNPAGQGIAIGPHTGSVELTNVNSSGNAGGGSAIYINGTGAVTIKNSSFDDNAGDAYVNGLYISTNGAVLLDGITVNHNGDDVEDYDGAFIESSGALTIKNSVFNNNFNFALSNNYPASGAITLDNVFVNNNGAGLWLGGKTTISVNGLHANDNSFQGAVFDTCLDEDGDPYNGSVVCTNPGIGNVTISNSEINDNDSNSVGLQVWAKGAITLTNVDASSNRGYDRDTMDPTYTTAGARLYNHYSTTAYPVTVNSSRFDYNSDDGLDINSKGLVTINKVGATGNGQGTAIDNYSFGIVIDNLGGTAGVTFNGTTWGDNSTVSNATGVRIDTNGNILINYLNSQFSTYLNGLFYNNTGLGNVTINKSDFSYTSNYEGLYVLSRGVITLNNVTASYAEINGAYLDNTQAPTPKAVIINTGSFNENESDGLSIFSHGAITLNNVDASYNEDYDEGDLDYYGFGAWLKNDYYTTMGGPQISQPVTVNNSTFYGNRRTGLWIDTFGAITLKGVTASWNSDWGANLDNYDATTPKAVTISNSVFNYNQNEGGLYVHAKGAVKFTNVGASENSPNNEWIDYNQVTSDVVSYNQSDSWWFYGTTGDIINIGVNLANPNSWGNFYIALYDEWGNPVTDGLGNPVDSEYYPDYDYTSGLSGFTLIQDGLYRIGVDTWYEPTTYRMVFWEGTGDWAGGDDITNWVYGMYIDNAYGTGVTIANPVNSWDYRFVGNNDYGLQVHSKGAIKGTNITATNNANMGGSFYNQDAGATAGITLIGSTFANNDLSGLDIQSYGAVLLTKTVAYSNLYYGANINNVPTGLTKPNVTIINDANKPYYYDDSGFSSNGQQGLSIESLGVISLTNVSASYNGWYGANLDNQNGLADVKLTNCHFDSNDQYGLEIYTRGNILYTNGSVSYNDEWGSRMEIQGVQGAADKAVTITKVSFNGNYYDGLAVENRGNITLTNVQANWNEFDEAKGAILDNRGGTGNITIKTSEFNGNGETGLMAYTRNNVTLTTVHADENGYMGAWIGTDPEPAKVVAISGMSTFNDNGYVTPGSGLEVYATGAITLTNVDAGDNGYWGAYLNNTYGATPANVSVLGTLANWINWFGYNGEEGLYILTNGAVIVNKVSASGNGSEGVYIDNSISATSPNVTINTGWYTNNMGIGLSVLTKGTVLVTGVEATSNANVGVFINNQYDTSSTKSVTVNKSTFMSNGSHGLEVLSYGNIIVNAITSTYNLSGGSGAMLNNMQPGSLGTITVLNTLGANTFNENTGHGLVMISNKAIVVTGVTANLNGERGIHAVNDGMGAGTGLVTLTKVTANYNTTEGVFIRTNGNITLTSAVAMFNGQDDPDTVGTIEAWAGFNIENYNSLSKTTFTNSVAIGNGGNGIYLIKHGGAYLLTNTLYFGNDASDDGYYNLYITDLP